MFHSRDLSSPFDVQKILILLKFEEERKKFGKIKSSKRMLTRLLF